MASSSNNNINFPNSTNPNPNSDSQTQTPVVIDPDSALSQSEYLTRREVLSRRSRQLHQLTKLYKHQYWALMEELKNQYGEYYWEYGKSPFVQQDDHDDITNHNHNNNNHNHNVVESEINNISNGGVVVVGEAAAAAAAAAAADDDDDDENSKAGKPTMMAVFSNRCAVQGCKMKAMQLTHYCNMHILRDDNQLLYKGCAYVIKSSQAGPILCSKPILRAAVPSLCTPHMQKAEKHVARALRKAGLSGHSTSKLAPQFHVIVAEYVNQIQAKRRAAREVKKEPCEVNEEDDISL